MKQSKSLLVGKKILATVISVGLLASLAQAKDKDFGVSVDPSELKTGKNNIEVAIKSKTIPVYDARVKLKIYNKNNTVDIYKTSRVNKQGKYVFHVNMPQAGRYNYLLSFNKMGGVNHVRRGSFEVR